MQVIPLLCSATKLNLGSPQDPDTKSRRLAAEAKKRDFERTFLVPLYQQVIQASTCEVTRCDLGMTGRD